MTTPCRAISVVVLACTLAVTLSAGPDDQRATAHEFALIDALNSRIQDRFRNLRDERFGYGRVAIRETTPHSFGIETMSEADALRDLRSARLGVIAFVVGRSILQQPQAARLLPEPPANTPPVPFVVRRALQGPVVITRDTLPVSDAQGMPSADDLMQEGREAMLAFTELESTEFSRAGWTFIARPVRATDRACFTCHRDASAVNPSQPETLLGAVLYGFKS